VLKEGFVDVMNGVSDESGCDYEGIARLEYRIMTYFNVQYECKELSNMKYLYTLNSESMNT
jgi:hypothetical protein